MRRTPLQIVCSGHAEYPTEIYALCNDGTMWELTRGHWTELPGIPQDESKDPLAKLHSRHVDLLDAHAAAKTQLHMLSELAGKLAGSSGSGPRREALREAGCNMMAIIDQ